MISIDQIQRIVKRCLEDVVLDASKVSAALNDDSLVTVKDFELDWLDLVELIMAVEDECGVRIEDTELDGVKINDIFIKNIPSIIHKAQEW